MLALTSSYGVWIHTGDTDRRSSWGIAQRVLAHYLLVVSLDGAEQIVVAGEHYAIPEGSAYLIQPGVLAERIGSKDGNRPAYFHFDLIFNSRRDEHRNTYSHESDLKGREHLLQPPIADVYGVELPVCVPKKLEQKFAASIEPIIRLWKTGHPYDVLSANRELEGLLLAWVAYEAARTEGGAPRIDPETRVRRAESAAQMNLHRGFDVNDFARATDLGRAQFARLYRVLRGESPGKALRDMRLNEAERLLRHTSLSVLEISKQVGYANASVLARSFQERYGATPSEWREGKE